MLRYTLVSSSLKEGQGLKYPVPKKSEFIILFIEQPTVLEIEKVSSDFDIHPEHFERFHNEKRSVRYSLNPFIFVILDFYLEKDIVQNPILFILQKNCLLIAVNNLSETHTKLYQTIISSLKNPKNRKISTVLYEFLRDDIRANYDVLEFMDRQMSALEKRILTKPKDAEQNMGEVMGLRDQFNLMQRRFWESSKIIYAFKTGLVGIPMDRETLKLLDDVYDTVMHQIDIVTSHKERVVELLFLQSTNISNELSQTSVELNVVMKKMTALTIILMIPTLIASMYGMNFRFMPEIYWKYGYVLALGLMIIAAYVGYRLFHKKEWI